MVIAGAPVAVAADETDVPDDSVDELTAELGSADTVGFNPARANTTSISAAESCILPAK